MRTISKDPDANLDYFVDWSRWMLDGDEIDTSEWFVSPDDQTLLEGAETQTTTRATIWLSGGTLGQTYTITNRILTTGGRTDDRSFKLVIRDR